LVVSLMSKVDSKSASKAEKTASAAGASGSSDTTEAAGRPFTKFADMPETMQHDAITIAQQSLAAAIKEKEAASAGLGGLGGGGGSKEMSREFDPTPIMANNIKREFDRRYGPTWHCIVGRDFGSFVTHESKHFIYFCLGQIAILLFRNG